jgi:predicted ATP-grasp superfamily ATP-dependent carboligase
MEEGTFELDAEPRPAAAIAGASAGRSASPAWPSMLRQPSAARSRRPRVLVVGIVPSLTWSVTRCLSRAGMRPVVMGWHRFSPLQLLPDCTYLPMRDLRWQGDEIEPNLIEQVSRACDAHGIDKVVPVDFPSVMLLSRYGDAIPGNRVSAVPNADTMLALHNKWQFSRAIERMGLPQPRTELARNRDELLHTRLRFPIITKPVDRWASVGFRLHETLQQLWQTLDAGKLGADFPVLVQEFIPGRDVGFAFLARHGRLIAHVAFEQLRRGVRRYYEAPELRRHVAQLLAATGYHGVGEVDARYDPSCGEYRLLEVNPRFWASLLYAEHAGMNFPELLVRLDELGDGPGFRAGLQEVRLSKYEIAVSKSVLWAEKAHNYLTV